MTDYASKWEAMKAIGARLGINAEMIHKLGAAGRGRRRSGRRDDHGGGPRDLHRLLQLGVPPLQLPGSGLTKWRPDPGPWLDPGPHAAATPPASTTNAATILGVSRLPGTASTNSQRHDE